MGASGINQVVSMIAGGVLGAAGSIGGDLIASGGDWSQVNVGKAISLYIVQGITKVSVATLGSTILGNAIGW